MKIQITLDDGSMREIADVASLPVVVDVVGDISEVDVKKTDGSEETFVPKV